jgi:site-specific recombinase XerD
MSKDYRTEFIRTVETTLINHFDPEQVNLISNVLAKTLAEYEITDRCTSIEPYDGGNERIIKQYAACLIVDGKSKNTVAQYVRTCRKLSETIGKPLTEMNAYDVRFFLAKEMERGISDQSRENQRANLSAFFQWMVNEEIIPKNPIAQIKPIKCHQEVKKAFSDIEIDALRSACKSLKERALIEFLLSTGARVSEVAEMKVQDVNIETLSVHILHGKGDKERITYTTAVGMKHLLAYIHSRKETGDALFYSKNHEPIRTSGIRFILNNVAKRAGVSNVHPHRFRRTFATNLSKRGMAVQEIQKLMGHANINTTLVYIATDDSMVQASYKKYTA